MQAIEIFCIATRNDAITAQDEVPMVIYARAVQCALLALSLALPGHGEFAFTAQNSSDQSATPFEDYFEGSAAAESAADAKKEEAFEKLLTSIGTMTASQIIAGLTVIDRQIDQVPSVQNESAKGQAIFLLKAIAYRQDAPALLGSQLDRLSYLLNEPSHRYSGLALMVFQMLGYQHPVLVWPFLEDALRNPEVNNETSIGPGIAAFLEFMGPHDREVTENVVRYMRRSDLSNKQLASTIEELSKRPSVSPLLHAEFIRCLDRPNDAVKIAALLGIAKSTSVSRKEARSRIERMAHDPNETMEVRKCAAEVLQGSLR